MVCFGDRSELMYAYYYYYYRYCTATAATTTCLIAICAVSVFYLAVVEQSLALGKERRLRLFENRVLRRICGSKRDEVTGECRKLHSEELTDLYSSPNIIGWIKSIRKRWAWHVARMGERRGVYRVLVGKPEGKRPLGRPRHRWEDNTKMDL